MSILKMTELDLGRKRVLIREDLNVPLRGGEVISDARLRAAAPTLRLASEAGAKSMVMSHLGRPEEGGCDPAFSLAPVAARLATLLDRPVRLAPDWLQGVDIEVGEVVLGENVRFNRGEKSDDDELSRRMAGLCDVFVMDAFGTAHRAHASTHGVARHAPTACAGPLLAAELEALGRAMADPARPVVAIVGGAKVSTKLGVLESLVGVVDQLIVGGGIANTFLAAQGLQVGASLHEPDLIPIAARLLATVRERGGEIPLPRDVVVAAEFSADAPATTKSASEVAKAEMILDVGPQTAAQYAGILARAGTVVWNGPVGVFEWPAFSAGTRALAQAIVGCGGFSIAGGGDTLAAIDEFEVAGGISYVSTGGGAFLEFLEGKTLPAVAVLEARARP